MRRLNLTVETVVADLSQWRPAAAADAILLDLPCSATGTIRRHPDVQHVKSPGDVRSLVQVQDRLLRRALEMIRPGGLLVACVCSLEAEEGPNRIAALLAEGAPLRRVPVSGCEVAGLDQVVSADGDLRTLPCHLADRGGFDGFYAARLQRL
jgi:16S rRNA (cytosine967-C5)-methyltransferase